MYSWPNSEIKNTLMVARVGGVEDGKIRYLKKKRILAILFKTKTRNLLSAHQQDMDTLIVIYAYNGTLYGGEGGVD